MLLRQVSNRWRGQWPRHQQTSVRQRTSGDLRTCTAVKSAPSQARWRGGCWGAWQGRKSDQPAAFEQQRAKDGDDQHGPAEGDQWRAVLHLCSPPVVVGTPITHDEELDEVIGVSGGDLGSIRPSKTKDVATGADVDVPRAAVVPEFTLEHRPLPGAT